MIGQIRTTAPSQGLSPATRKSPSCYDQDIRISLLAYVIYADLPAFSLISSSIASELARCLDLNSLHELSRTNRQIRANLLQFRTQLINHTLRCENEIGSKQIGDRLVEGLRGAMASWSTFGHNGVQTGRITSGKVGLCARDMVGECRKCGRIVCRVSQSILCNDPRKTEG